MAEKRECWVVIRVRGESDISGEIEETLKMLNLTRNCHAILIDDRPSYRGMLRKTRNYLTWGEISEENLERLLRKRGRLRGNRRLTDERVQEYGYDSLSDLATAIHQLKLEYPKLPDIKPIFRLRPPTGGFKGKVKRSYAAGGVTGYRGEAINELIKRMT
ncbi:50S ribosomal protein L30 [Candidatus Bathyarchaeota archaeon]|nr:50S ribosomal protein L30 [Candidatus Bathyarchaeota archaeon]NIU81027.1 50S ribosomal protein L30 [Candidatus Bathyarchaeota archaeon]NIV67685.1 50S ribosomal protein L30 [Candidatus Bathyarchaeota archaeon]NIW16670.1 50S ribosomal protein L30 [Candidatus Bathyarchaeota archaeon]NIW34884.1 50S ribosomal protein L30 [Candidatus Bathyarchaeota archaeon]